jgi:hypothetical protein
MGQGALAITCRGVLLRLSVIAQVRAHVQSHFAFDLPVDALTTMRRARLLRRVALKIGVQVMMCDVMMCACV